MFLVIFNGLLSGFESIERSNGVTPHFKKRPQPTPGTSAGAAAKPRNFASTSTWAGICQKRCYDAIHKDKHGDLNGYLNASKI